MTGSPFSNVVGHDAGSGTFTRVESTQVTDTTTETGARPADQDGESSLGVEVQAGVLHEAGQDETAGAEASGTPTAGS